jgi:signal transduction histidine kinase
MRLGIVDFRSLKVRLMLLAALSIGATLVVAGLSISLIYERHIMRRVAEELSVRWNELAGAVALDSAGRPVVRPEPTDPRYVQPLSGAYWQVDGPAGEALRSRSLWDRGLDLPADAPADEAFEIDGFEKGSEFYVVSRPVVIDSGTARVPLRLTVVLDHHEIEALSEAFDGDLVKALAVIAGALFAGALLQANLGLAPLTALRRRVAGIRSGATERMGSGFPSEIQPLADDLDRLLDRQDALVARARDRAGALAHGFKTPLTILTLEARRLQEAGQVASAKVLRDQIETMRRHVERELARARIRGAGVADTALGAARTVEVRLTVQRLVDLVRRMPFADALTFTVEVPSDLRLRMDRDDFGEVLGNLLDNARKWAVSTVEVRAVADGDVVRLEVVDDGPGFGGGDGGERNADGSGLGLSIVEDVLGAYGTGLMRDRRDGRTVMAFRIVPDGAREALAAAE